MMQTILPFSDEIEANKHRKIFIRRTVQKKRFHANPMELPLCARCAQQFYDSPWHRISRMDPCQVIFDTCAFCNVRRGYDYRIYDYRKPVVKQENIIVIG